MHVTKNRGFIFSLSPVNLNERQWKNQMANFGNVQNLPFVFFPLSPRTITYYSRFDKLSDRDTSSATGKLTEKGTKKKGKLSTSHRYDLLPLLPSDPGGIQRELVVYDFP